MSARILSRWIDHIVGVGPLRPFFQNPRRILRNYVKPGMTVLDIGCGGGFFSLGMARMVGENGGVISVDLQAEAIKNLEMQATKAGLLKRINTRVCSDYSLNIDDMAGHVDFTLAFYVVHHAADAARLMTEVHSALKQGGKLMIVEPRHHASADECISVETTAQQAGFSVVDHPKLIRDWAVLLVKN
ncbi:MAG: methyltransferase domain-containing protein [Candidatus Zixiibacteriota bacterium]